MFSKIIKKKNVEKGNKKTKKYYKANKKKEKSVHAVVWTRGYLHANAILKCTFTTLKPTRILSF